MPGRFSTHALRHNQFSKYFSRSLWETILVTDRLPVTLPVCLARQTIASSQWTVNTFGWRLKACRLCGQWWTVNTIWHLRCVSSNLAPSSNAMTYLLISLVVVVVVIQHIMLCQWWCSPQICINILQIPYLLFTSYHVATDKPPPKMATSSGLFLATIYNQSQLAERKHVARYWSINTAATAVPLSAHPSP